MEIPTFWPGIHTPNEDSTEHGSFSHLPRLDFTTDYTVSDYQLMSRIRWKIQNGGPLEVVGRGGDMVAYSRPDLDFVVKFPYDGDSLKPTGFNYRLAYGYSLAKENLGGILVPGIDVYGIFTDVDGEEYGVMTLVQRKIRTFNKVIRELLTVGRSEEVSGMKKVFADVSQQMWERGIFDRDSDWEENYGLLSRKQPALIDIGDLSDDPNQFPLDEGVARIHHYEPDLRDHFMDENFRRFFGKKPHLRRRSPNSLTSLQSRSRLRGSAIRQMYERDDERALQIVRQMEREDADWN